MARDFMPTFVMIWVQVGFAGLNVVSKLAMDSGMNPFVMVAYRQIFAFIVTAPFAYFYESFAGLTVISKLAIDFGMIVCRQIIATIVTAPYAHFREKKTRLRITKKILFQIFLCSIFGATMNQCLYFLGLKYTTATIACALNNLLPAITFLMAVPLGMETVGIRRLAGQAKVIGTISCVGGAMLMTFYKGKLVHLWESNIHWTYAINMRHKGASHEDNMVLGCMLVVASCFGWAVWFVIQAKMSRNFACPYTSSSLMCFMASIQCSIIGACLERKASGWALGWNIRLVASAYTGIVNSGISVSLMTWCIQRRGPLFVSMFSPLLLIIVAIIGWAFLEEKLYVGTVVGSTSIVVGLYAVLWGKGREMNDACNMGRIMEMEHEEEHGIHLPVYKNAFQDGETCKANGGDGALKEIVG